VADTVKVGNAFDIGEGVVEGLNRAILVCLVHFFGVNLLGLYTVGRFI